MICTSGFFINLPTESRAEKTVHELINCSVCAENYGEPMYVDSYRVLIMLIMFAVPKWKTQFDQVDNVKALSNYQNLKENIVNESSLILFANAHTVNIRINV